ncbi:uncharacterized protein SEPMUDRAFT_106122 [Sphaerulina musiva SO2202]|uniref:Uncharacterized protein n=1 Tax=Sphaerulina musiva (strain SO2202) TaxID=692275 RepID=M3CQI4_SPHMS|nr:uncharacterized protein SEPMUDRAFT_106122 [Sphaerulina musiva SO2202]EMF15938.1 hypothetical protein SEPMUDRAFT_106122 [Sphaerulina musiva SO2202]
MHLFLDFNSSRDQFPSAISEPPTPSLDGNVLQATEIPSHQIQQQRILRTGIIEPPPIYEDRAQPIQQQSIPPGTSEVREEQEEASRETLITAQLVAQYIPRPPPPQPSSSYPYSHFRFPSNSTLHTSSISIPTTATFSDFLRTILNPLLLLLQTEREAEAESQILQTTAGTITTATTTTTSTYNNNNNNEELQCEIYFLYPKFNFNLHLGGKWKLKWNKWMRRNSSGSTMRNIQVNEENWPMVVAALRDNENKSNERRRGMGGRGFLEGVGEGEYNGQDEEEKGKRQGSLLRVLYWGRSEEGQVETDARLRREEEAVRRMYRRTLRPYGAW